VFVISTAQLGQSEGGGHRAVGTLWSLGGDNGALVQAQSLDIERTGGTLSTDAAPYLSRGGKSFRPEQRYIACR
jgi:hypothetical protein